MDASNRVEVGYRINGGALQVAATRWLRTDHSRKAHYFKAQIPSIRAGDTLEYNAVCDFAGRRVPSPEEAESNFARVRVVGDGAETEWTLSGEVGRCRHCAYGDGRVMQIFVAPDGDNGSRD